MDFIKFIRSLEEFLYEVLTWILFYPRTLWLVALHPIQSLQYSRAEQQDPVEDQYADRVSPPLCLMLTLVIAHMVELAAHIKGVQELSGPLSIVTGSQQNLLILRSVVYALFPLMFAAEEVRRSGQSLDRTTLRAPFFGQCYLASLFTVFISAAGILAQEPSGEMRGVGFAIFLPATLWYVVIQIRWFRLSYGLTWLRATSTVLVALGKAVAVIFLGALLVGLAA